MTWLWIYWVREVPMGLIAGLVLAYTIFVKPGWGRPRRCWTTSWTSRSSCCVSPSRC